MKALPYQVARNILIHARPETVFTFFTDSQRWARWWGAGSAIDARAGGALKIRYPNGVEALGEVVEISAPDRIVFTFGYESGKPIPMGGSRVTIQLQAEARGTRVNLRHEFKDAAVRDDFIQGWRFQLSLFTNAVSNEANANAAATVDRWFSTWSVSDDAARERELSAIVSPAVQWRDQYSSLEGVSEISPHIGAAQRFMPRVTLKRVGDIRHCQGMLLSQWVAANDEGKKVMEGTNVFLLDADGRIESVTGFHAQ